MKRVQRMTPRPPGKCKPRKTMTKLRRQALSLSARAIKCNFLVY